MRFEIVVAKHPARAVGLSRFPSPPASSGGADPLARSECRRAARDVLDVFIDGANLPPGVREMHRAFVLRDLALALVQLSFAPRAKTCVRFFDDPWELAIERFGATACLSVYRAGPQPVVSIYDRAVAFDAIVAAARDVIDALITDASTQDRARVELVSAVGQLHALVPGGPGGDVAVPVPTAVSVEPDRDSPLSFGAEFAIREGIPSRLVARGRDASPEARGRDASPEARGRDASPEACGAGFDAVERSDVHALLFRGRMRAEIHGRAIDLGDGHPVLVAERLVELGRRAFDAWERGLPLHARVEAGGVLVGVRVRADGELALTLGAAPGGARRAVHTFPALGVVDVLEATLAFGRALVRAILRRDRSQSANLRLSAFRRALRESTEALHHASQTDAKINPTPEPYRAFAALEETRQVGPFPLPASRLRYAPRWRAIIPGIDLRSTYLCGDRVVVGAASEMWALDRASGRVLWRTDVPRGTSFVTPGGIARLATDGALLVFDFATGECTLRTRIAPRVGGGVAGAVVHLPGLPRMVIVTEGDHHLVAVDLATGEPRWRWSWGATRGPTRGAPRIKRAGRLLYFTSGDGALTALDVMMGAVVWRVRDRLRFRTPPTVARDALFVVSGGAHGVARLYCIDPYAGHVRWATGLADPSAPCTVQGAPIVAGGAVAVPVRRKQGLVLAAFRVDDGSALGPAHRTDAPLGPAAAVGTSWLAVDDAFIGNAPTGEIVAIDATSGELRWRHVLGPRPLEADVPRRLEPVLRCGALFVPCSLVPHGTGGGGPAPNETETSNGRHAAAGVCILRPSDGSLIGSIAPAGAIPDLLRVDERCDVYVAEDSGHLAAFGARSRLSIVV
jgi:outer membrane protein assembly factor BamB